MVYEENMPINTYQWDVTDTLRFNVYIEDTQSKYDLSLNVRHRDVYDFMNLYVKILTRFPDGKLSSDVISLPLCDETGKWLGKCSGDICFAKVILQKKMYFKSKGTYTFFINQEMRQERLQNILDIGLKVEKSKKKVYSDDEQ